MKRRWKHDDLKVWWVLTAAVWFVFGLIVFCVVGQFTDPCDSSPRHSCGLESSATSLPSYIVLGLWMGPYALVVAGGLLALMAWLWHERPRRVVEPITTDLRKDPR